MSTHDNYELLQKVMHEYGDWVESSAGKILPWVGVTGKSVVDFGCGQGHWLRTAKQMGASNVLGLDTFAVDSFSGDLPVQYVDLTQDIVLPRTFDLAICLEVAEHLPQTAAATLVRSLVRAAPLVLFSAAVPGQGGIHHLNEQSPQYWFDLFESHGYACLDFRDEVWSDESIEPWYRMNTLVFAQKDAIPRELMSYQVTEARHIIHPDIFQAYAPQEGQNIILLFDRVKKQWFPQFTN